MSLPHKTPAKHLNSFHAHSKCVKLLRIILPIFIIVFLVSVVLWPHLAKTLMVSPLERIIRKTNLIINPRIASTDENGKPYSIKAKSAEQIDEMSAALNNPSGKFVLEDGTKVEVSATNGDLKKREEALNLSGSVDLKSENGYALKAPSAVVDLKAKTTETFEPVYGKGPQGEIEADKGVKISSDGSIHFKGKTKLTIQQKQKVNE